MIFEKIIWKNNCEMKTFLNKILLSFINNGLSTFNIFSKEKMSIQRKNFLRK